MLNDQELERISTQAQSQDIPTLVAEIHRLRTFLQEMGTAVESRLDEIEGYRQELVNENARLLAVKDGFQAERDACLALLAKMSLKAGINAGFTAAQQLAIELPAGQVSWEISATEAHLFQDLPAYTQPVQEQALIEKYQLVMNPGEL